MTTTLGAPERGRNRGIPLPTLGPHAERRGSGSAPAWCEPRRPHQLTSVPDSALARRIHQLRRIEPRRSGSTSSSPRRRRGLVCAWRASPAEPACRSPGEGSSRNRAASLPTHRRRSTEKRHRRRHHRRPRSLLSSAPPGHRGRRLRAGHARPHRRLTKLGAPGRRDDPPPDRSIGVRAMRTLRSLIGGRKPRRRRHVIDVELVVRHSCGSHTSLDAAIAN